MIPLRRQSNLSSFGIEVSAFVLFIRKNRERIMHFPAVEVIEARSKRFACFHIIHAVIMVIIAVHHLHIRFIREALRKSI